MALKRDAAVFKNVQTLHILFFFFCDFADVCDDRERDLQRDPSQRAFNDGDHGFILIGN